MNLAEKHHKRLKSIIEAKGEVPSDNYALDYLDATMLININDSMAEVELSVLRIVYSTLAASLSREKVLRKALENIERLSMVESKNWHEHKRIARAALASTETE